MSLSHRTWLLASLGATISAASGIAINVATDLQDRWWAWVSVGVLAAATAGLTVTAELWRQRDQMSPETVPIPRVSYGNLTNFRTTTSGGTINQTVNVNSSVFRTVLALTSVVWLTAAGGLVAGAILSRPNSIGPASGLPPSVVAKTKEDFCTTWVTENSKAEINSSLPIPSNLFGYGQWSDWSAALPGASATPGEILITVQGVDSTQVVLTDIRVRVLAKRAPVVGLALTRECGDEGAYRLLAVDLDHDPPAVTNEETGYTVPPNGEPAWSITPIRFPYEVSASDAETFAIRAGTTLYDVDWMVEVDWSSAGQSGTVVVNDGGIPFRTTSTQNAENCNAFEALECF